MRKKQSNTARGSATGSKRPSLPTRRKIALMLRTAEQKDAGFTSVRTAEQTCALFRTELLRQAASLLELASSYRADMDTSIPPALVRMSASLSCLIAGDLLSAEIHLSNAWRWISVTNPRNQL